VSRPVRGTAYAGIRTDSGIYRRGAKALAEGLGIRGTGRLVEARTGKDTVMHWLPILGQHGQGVMNYFFRHLHLMECHTPCYRDTTMICRQRPKH
jgi:hypothetical protein